jgi:integrase
MQTRFKFTNTNLKAIAANDINSRSTELELSDSELSGLKLLVGKSGNKRFLFRYSHQSKKRSITIGKFPDLDSRDVCFHTARHSVASALVSSGKSLYDVKTQLGHASIVSSERYAKLTEERQRATGQAVSDLISG